MIARLEKKDLCETQQVLNINTYEVLFILLLLLCWRQGLQ